MEGQVFRHSDNSPVFRQALVFGITSQRSTGKGENLFANLKSRYIFANGLDDSGEFASQNGLSWFCQAEDETGDKTKTGRHVETPGAPISRSHGCCLRSDQNFIFVRDGFLQLFESEDFRWTVFRIYDCFHRCFILIYYPLPLVFEIFIGLAEFFGIFFKYHFFSF